MKLINIFLAILPMLQVKAKIQVDIYIESYCKFSQEFILEEFTPDYEALKDDISVHFFTAGKSSSFVDEYGEVVFRCQHGPAECRRNVFQTCGLNAIGDNQDKQVAFMNCTMRLEIPFEECCSLLDLNYEAIEGCSSSQEGVDLQLKVLEMTTPILDISGHIPTITFDGKYDENDLNVAVIDFKGLILRKLRDNLENDTK